MENNHGSLEKEINVSLATLQDVKAIQEVIYKTWIDTYPNQKVGITIDDIEDKFKNTFTKDGIEKSNEKFLNRTEGEMTFVAKEKNIVVGVCRITVSGVRNRINAIYVLPDYQSKGIGKKLWGKAQEFFDKNKDILISVASYNTNAIEFYKKLGFEDTGKRWNDEKFKMKSGANIPEMEMIIKKKELKNLT